MAVPPIVIEGISVIAFELVNQALRQNGLNQLSNEQRKKTMERLKTDARLSALLGVSELRSAIDENQADRMGSSTGSKGEDTST